MRANSMIGRALLVLLPLMMAVGSAGSAEAGEYIWVRQSTQPADAVLDPGGDRAVCRLTEPDAHYDPAPGSRLWVGWFNRERGMCIASDGGGENASSENLEFLVLTPAPGNAVSWVNMGWEVTYADRHPDALSAGMNRARGVDLAICSHQGYIGWIRWANSGGPGRCTNWSAPFTQSGYRTDTYKLTGTVVSIYD